MADLRWCWRCGLMVYEGEHDPVTGKFLPESVVVRDEEIERALRRSPNPTDDTPRDAVRVAANIALGKHCRAYAL